MTMTNEEIQAMLRDLDPDAEREAAIEAAIEMLENAGITVNKPATWSAPENVLVVLTDGRTCFCDDGIVVTGDADDRSVIEVDTRTYNIREFVQYLLESVCGPETPRSAKEAIDYINATTMIVDWEGDPLHPSVWEEEIAEEVRAASRRS